MNTFTVPTYPSLEKGQACIYSLVDPVTGEVRWVGQTVRPAARAKEHLRTTYATVEEATWIEALTRKGLTPIFVTLDVVPFEDRKQVELLWIKRMLAQGEPLTNYLGTGKTTSAYRYSRMTANS